MNQKPSCQLTFVIPIYNEAKRLPSSFQQIQTFLPQLTGSFEWIFVLEPSTDRSIEIVHDFCKKNPSIFRYIQNEVHLGKGYAVQTGILAAKGEYVFFMDADLSTPLKEILRFHKIMKTNTALDILIGSRYVTTSQVKTPQGPLRILLGKFLRFYLQLLKISEFHDTQCGFKAFKSEVAKQLFQNLQCKGFAFDIEILAKAKQKSYHIKEEGVEWMHDDASSIRPVRDGIKVAKDILTIYQSIKKDFK